MNKWSNMNYWLCQKGWGSQACSQSEVGPDCYNPPPPFTVTGAEVRTARQAVIHQAWSLLENKDSYVRMLFLDLSSAFNTIIPQTLVNKLSELGPAPSLDLLTDSPQCVKINSISSSITVSTRYTRYTPLTHDCRARPDAATWWSLQMTQGRRVSLQAGGGWTVPLTSSSTSANPKKWL